MTRCRSNPGLIWTRQFIRRKQGAITIMVGRPRKIGKRQPNGQLARAYVDPRKQVASQPHRCDVAKVHRMQPEAGTRFGRMMLNGRVTMAQFTAGNEYARLVADNRRAVFAPPMPGAMGFEGGSRGSAEGLPDHDAKSAVRRFTAAFNAIKEVGWQLAVMHVAVHDRAIVDELDYKRMICGLNKLVTHFGLDPKMQISKSRT